MSLRILVTGARDWDDRGIVSSTLEAFGPGHTLIHGDCPTGADAIAHETAARLGWAIEPMPAEWRRYGPAAGPIRNRRMLEEGRPHLVLAFHLDLDHSKGTADCVRQARDRRIPVWQVIRRPEIPS
jgi:hypothetical protein